jgi:hypothetical protein
VSPVSEPLPVVKLACTACQLVYPPTQPISEPRNTGCPRCGGWTGSRSWSPALALGSGLP